LAKLSTLNSSGVHAAGLADPRQVIAHQIHDHQVFRPILQRSGQRIGFGPVLLGIRPARAGALDGPGLDSPLADACTKRSGELVMTT
jgi:hypothetical protein